MNRLAALAVALLLTLPALAQKPGAPIEGRWISPESVTFTNPALAGSAFHLDIVVAQDGAFQGTWDSYQCFSYPSTYGAIISCSRVKHPAKARGRLDRMAGRGEIELEKLGRTSFKYKLAKELVLELPKDWQRKGGDAVLYTSKLSPAPRR
jgi:hypothetical protein